MNADTDQVIGQLQNGQVLDLTALPTQNLNIRANLSPATTGSVVFGLDANPNFRTENAAPYAMAGDNAGDFLPWTPSLGGHTVTATSYLLAGAAGSQGNTLVISFQVVNGPIPTPTPTATPTSPSGIAVTSFTLINADTNADLGTISNNATINLANLPTQNLNVRANTSGSVGSVQFSLDGNSNFRTESSAPYALAGDVAGNYNAWTPSLGAHVLGGIPFSGPGATGTQGTGLTVNFSVTSQAEPTPTPTATPTNPPGSGSTLIRCGSSANYVDTQGRTWIGDAGLFAGTTQVFSTGNQIVGTNDDALYQTERWGQSFSYSIPVSNGSYAVILHFSENYFSQSGQRIFSVALEGAPALQNLDIFAESGQFNASTKSLSTQVNDGVLDISFSSSVNNAKISGIEIRPQTHSGTRIRCGSSASYTDPQGQVWSGDSGLFSGTTQTFSSSNAIGGTNSDPLYQTERFGQNFAYAIPVSANGLYDVTLHFAELYWTQAGQRVFNVSLEGSTVQTNLDLFSEAGANNALTKEYTVSVSDGVLNIGFAASINNAKISGIEVHPSHHGGHPYLHVVIDAPPYLVDYDQNGSEVYPFSGTGSHTHEPGHSITGWEWRKGAAILGTTPVINPVLAHGAHDITLEIEDTFTNPPKLEGSVTVNVYPINAVGGTLTDYYVSQGLPLGTLIDSLPQFSNFREISSGYSISENVGLIGGSPFAGNLVATMKGSIALTTGGTYEFLVTGPNISRLILDGTPYTGPRALSAGQHSLEARFAIPNVSSLPARVQMKLNGGPTVDILPSSVSHSHTSLPPFINTMPANGSTTGGENITISGLGFFPTNSVVVHWGGANISGAALSSVSPGSISFTAPAGAPGQITVTVQTPNGTSNPKTYTRSSGTVPITFGSSQTLANPTAPTQAAWGPDGRLYVGSFAGFIYAYTFDDNYSVTNVQQISTLTSASNPTILGIAFNPLDPPSPVKLYVAHSDLFAYNGGQCFSGPAGYSGQVSLLQGPGFGAAQPLITGLPVSNHDHGINGLQFDNYGNLFIAVGGNTNGGVHNCGADCCNIGNLPESPLSAAVVKARLSKPGFNGTVTYVNSSNGLPNNNSVFGDSVDVASGVDLEIYSSGFRNVFDILWGTRDQLYGTDNGPNVGFGPFSTGPTTQIPPQNDADEVLLMLEGNYYGHPNRNRGRYDARQNVYRGSATSPILGQYSPPLSLGTASTNGVDEYRATTFNSAMRGNLLLQRFMFTPGLGDLSRVALSSDGRAVTQQSILKASSPGLDVIAGPGGAILVTDYIANALKLYNPNDLGALPMQAYDIFPWRARAQGGDSFVIGGVGFGGSTTVAIGGIPATVTSVSPTRIKGTIPANPNPTAQFLPISVQSSGQNYTIPNAFRYVLGFKQGKGTWTTGATLPDALGEVAGGFVNGVMYLVGHGSSQTFAYNHFDGSWTQGLATRPFVGDHHGAEVIGNKLYLIGGIGGGSERKLQVYDPATNSWTSSNIPSAVDWGSPSTAVINGVLYIAGGIQGTTTHNQAMKYVPQSGVWSAIASMPVGRNHAASSTDGSKFYVFGGRDGANVVAPGFNDVQIYDPVSNTWQWSAIPAHAIPALPQARGGMGKAAYFNREFYVIGGETNQPSSATYNRVDVYDPVAKTWRLEQQMPTARHGIFPLVFDGKIFVAAGGVQAGHSESAIVEIFAR